MESEGGGVVTPRRLSSQHSTLRETFLASDLAESLNNLSIIDSNDNNNNGSLVNPRPVSNLTLGAVLNSTRKSPPPNVVVRTLLEIIRNDETLLGAGSSTSNHFAGKKSWKSFKDRLKLKKTSNQNHNPNSSRWAALSSVPQSDVLPHSRSIREEAMNAHRNSLLAQGVDTDPSNEPSLREGFNGESPRTRGSFRLSEALAAEREDTQQRVSRELVEGNGGENRDNVGSTNSVNYDESVEEGEQQPGPSAPANQPVRMSLMELLEETEQPSGVRGPTYRFDDNEENDEEAEEAEEEEEDIGKEVHSCCVCMVRHKGAAFIPCGHTFCRKCSRELWVQRGNCPLCNNFILEILDIF